ncbi:hypothetical protein J3B02_003440 [Coemansia erecta]|uniref:HMG box domain-containing protein n=1 Tax=Coemansia asiatica TaxID=1052880 RepID=A0A9W8CN50_9FUNG|nr:hypothetical protein LPJ64_000155 [Coemansia asiatica]KAJ2852788.1 hypothetical protein J3B02_003440 [Coemansia erecta]KAJ2880477.1 hypothetical protein FB639_002820 [Coemansia asiatica]
MSHTNSSHSAARSPSTAESPSSAETPNSNSTGPGLGLQNHYQQQQYSHHTPATSSSHSLQHQQSYSDAPTSSQPSYAQPPPTSTLQQQHSGYPSAFSSTTSATSPQLQQQQQQSAHPASGLLYQSSPQNNNQSAQYVSQDQQNALAPLQFGSLGVIGQQRPASSFPYDFDPNDANCRNMYAAADMDPSHHVPQQLTTSGYIRHGGGILVSSAQPPSALSSMHAQQQQQQQQQQPSLDMTAAAAAANISLPVDINGSDHSAQGQQQAQQHQQHLQHPSQAASAMHTSNPQSQFGSSPVGNQPIFTTLSFQNSQLQEYDPYARPAKRSGRTTKPKRTPRPPNAFILYRKAKQAEVIRDNPGVSNKDVSCIIGQMWKSEDPAVQDQFREQAEVEKKKHKEMHPNYKYQPRKPKNKRLQESQAAGATAVNSALAAGGSQDGSFASTGLSMNSANSVLSSALKEPSTSASANAPFQSYSKYHLMMQQGQTPQQQQQQAMQIQHPQTPVSQQQQQQTHLGRGDEYYYRGAGAMAESQQHIGNSFVGVAPQLDIKSGSFVGGIPASAYWTPTTPSDAAFSNTLPSANVFHGNGSDQTAHMRSFDTSSVAQHSAAGHAMGASPAQLFHPFDHQRQSQQQQQQQHHHHQQQQQQIHDGQGHMDYQTGQQQQFHQHHGHSQQQQQQQQGPHVALGGYVNGGQTYHHSQPGMEGLDSTSVAAADSQGLGLLSPPTVAWSTNM